MRITSAIVLALLLIVSGAVSAQDAQTPAALCEAATPTEPETREYDIPEWVLESDVDYRAVLCTDAGAIYVDLFEDYAPVTVNNFVFLAQNDYYNNTTFHRVIENFMAQGGDPTGTGTGGPGYQFQDEFVGFLNFDRPGWLAMANANRPEQGIVGTNGSQFFITTVPTPHLDYRHTIFGEVLEGQEHVEALEIRDPATATDPGTALNTVLIIDDPATLETTFADSEPATREEIEAAFESINDILPEGMEHTLVSQSTDEVIDVAPDAVKESLDTVLNGHNHQFRVKSNISGCILDQAPFMQVSYTLDAFASNEDAAAALLDSALAETATADGLTEILDDESLPSIVYTGETTVCDTPAIRAVTHWPRGRFVVTAEITIPADSPASPDQWLTQVVGLRLYEIILSDILRDELR